MDQIELLSEREKLDEYGTEALDFNGEIAARPWRLAS
jgi:hypothetical protein